MALQTIDRPAADLPAPLAAADRASGNAAIADMLRETATLLDAQGANPFRAAAYREAADTIAGWPVALRALFERDGRDGLEALPTIGRGIAAAIAEILVSGRWSQLDALRGDADPVRLFTSIPGVGAGLGQRIHEALGVASLEDLEAAALDGRLERVAGVGARRAAAIRAALGQMLDRTRALRRVRSPAPAPGAPARPGPDVAQLLEIDRAYRARAQAGTLPTITPRRFNPSGASWLPVLHARRGDWQFTALYSNTARAHELHRERDWVVIYCHDDDHAEQRHTVVTETRGALAGRRVVRGREPECTAYYAQAS